MFGEQDVQRGVRQQARQRFADGLRMRVVVAGNDDDRLLDGAQLVFADGTTDIKSTLSGIVYDWKNHMLLRDVTVSLAGGAPPPEGANAPIQFKGLTWDANGHASVEVWSHSVGAYENVGFKLEIAGASGITFTASALPATTGASSGWSLLNTVSATTLKVGGFTSIASDAVAATDFKLGSVTFDTGAGAQGVDLRLLTGEVGNTTASAYGLSAARTSVLADGTFNFNVQPGNYSLTASRPTTDTGNALTSADALGALKLAQGLNPNIDPDGAGPKSALVVSPYQFMAADVVGSDGRITPTDALAILHMVIELPSAPAKEWLFVEESRDFWNETTKAFTLDRDHASWDHTISVTAPGQTNLVGVLKGDVNGSWAAPAGSTDLDTINPTYFNALTNLYGMPLAQFGV